jgi:hypothetical protein
MKKSNQECWLGEKRRQAACPHENTYEGLCGCEHCDDCGALVAGCNPWAGPPDSPEPCAEEEHDLEEWKCGCIKCTKCNYTEDCK